MARQKTHPTGASVDEYLAAIPGEVRRADCEAVLALMREETGEEPRMWGPSMVGFGSYHYRYASGREGDCFVTGFSPRRGDLTVYVMSGLDRHPELLARLGRHRTGKSCLYLKRLSDVDTGVLRQLVADSVRYMVETYPPVGG